MRNCAPRWLKSPMKSLSYGLLAVKSVWFWPILTSVWGPVCPTGNQAHLAGSCNPDRCCGDDAAGDRQKKGELVASGRVVDDACDPRPVRPAAGQGHGDGAEYGAVVRPLEDLRNNGPHDRRQGISQEALRDHHQVEQAG